MKYMLLVIMIMQNQEQKQKIYINPHQLEYLKKLKIFGFLIKVNQKLNQQDLLYKKQETHLWSKKTLQLRIKKIKIITLKIILL